jgi:hypothetical protein
MAAIMPKTDIRATLGFAIRVPGRDGLMKRAARFQTGSVVFDKRRKTWNYLWCEGGKRRSKLIGTLQEFPTKGGRPESSTGNKAS